MNAGRARVRIHRRRPLPPPIDAEARRLPALTEPVGRTLHRTRQRVFESNAALTSGLVLFAGFVGAGVAAAVKFRSNLIALPLNSSYGILSAPPGPSPAHPFGVMARLGVDVASALLQATPWDLALMGLSVAGAAVLGGAIGVWDGIRNQGGRGSTRWIADTITSVPPFFLALAVLYNAELVLPRAAWIAALVVTLAVVLSAQHVRPVTAAARTVARSAYAESARASGARTLRIMVRHVWPNSLYPSLAQIPVDVFNVVFLLTAFPFIGCIYVQSLVGFTYPNPLPSVAFPEWGFLLASGVCYGFSAVDPLLNWWMWFFPAVVILVFGATVALICDGLLTYLRRGHR
jgi:peptide/nickel transport system permease protein